MTTDADRLVGLLSKALGEPRARELVHRAAKDAAIDLDRLAIDNVLHLLELLAHEPGLTGITARFAKSRALLLPWGR